MSDDLIKCDVCGRFVSYDDLDAGHAHRHLITPDSDYSTEEFKTLCPKCVLIKTL